MQQIRYKVKKS